MSTRSVVAVPTEDGGWRGRYIHYDGYPTGVGADVVAVVRRDGLPTARETLMRGTWKGLHAPGRNSDNVPGYGDLFDDDHSDYWDTSDQPPTDREWAYVLADEGLVVHKGTWNTWTQRGVVPWDAPDADALLETMEDEE